MLREAVITEELLAKVESLPARPGCYLFKDRNGQMLYVGKASNLHARVRSYLKDASTDTRAFLPLLRRNMADLETIVTASEKEAAILEASLVKQHRPRYNVKLRDDKSYLSLRLDLSHPFPRLELVRRPSPDGARYFGPHHSATAARRTLYFINKHFHLRTCSDHELGARKRPCLQYHIKRCPGPCVYEIDRARYAANVQATTMLLDGRHAEVLGQIEARMREASQRTNYELAATYRDQLVALRAVLEGQRVVSVDAADRDVLGLYRDGELCEVAVVFVRAGRVVDTVSFGMRKVGLPDEEVIGAFVTHYYGDEGPAAYMLPDEILVPVLPEGATGVAEWLSERKGKKVKLGVARRGPRLKLLDLARDNARHAFEEKRRAKHDIERRLGDIQARLRLAAPPRVIECCDISHLGGADTVGGIVRMVDGELSKSGYRCFHVREVADGDDYAAIYEVLARRFRRGREAQEQGGLEPEPSVDELRPGEEGTGAPSEAPSEAPSDTPTEDAASSNGATVGGGWEMPDLLVIDGGRGQLRAGLAAAHDLGLHELSIVALAKERETAAGETLTDRIYVPGQKNGIPVRPHTPLVLLARARDEAHRFANRMREKLGKGRRLGSELDEIAGIGGVTRRKLLIALGSVKAVREASDEELRAAARLTRRQLAALREHFARRDP